VLDDVFIRYHCSGTITAAHSLIGDTGHVTHIVIDYNGSQPERFYHVAGKVLSDLGYNDLITFHSKTRGHLHLYIPVDKPALQEAIETGKIISKKLDEKMTKAWRVLPSDEVPDVYNILNLPFEAYTPFKGHHHA